MILTNLTEKREFHWTVSYNADGSIKRRVSIFGSALGDGSHRAELNAAEVAELEKSETFRMARDNRFVVLAEGKAAVTAPPAPRRSSGPRSRSGRAR